MWNRQLRTFLLACAPLVLAGCADPARPEAPVDAAIDAPPSEAQIRFMRDVYPILSLHCSACHSEAHGGSRAFVGTDPAEGYTRILAFLFVVGDFSANAPIATVPAIGHNGVTYTPAEQAAILDWLAAERAERGGAPRTSPAGR